MVAATWIAALPTGTVFGVYRNPNYDLHDPVSVVKQKGCNLVVAGYCLYSAATHLVITLGSGVQQFTLDDITGEFYLTKESFRIPQIGGIYSFNAANQNSWHHSVQHYFHDFKKAKVSMYDLAKPRKVVHRYNPTTKQVYQEFQSGDRKKSLEAMKEVEIARLQEEDLKMEGAASERAAAACRKTSSESPNGVKPCARYMGALVADAHNILCNGGIFAYPGTVTKPSGKIRLLYEANPMAMVFEQAGGMASNGFQRILDIPIDDIHVRTPIFIGSAMNVAALQRYCSFYEDEV